MPGGAPLGNTNGTKGKPVSDMLRRVVTQNPNQIRKACMALINKAAKGDLPSLREIADRLEGKPIQAVTGSGDFALVRIERVLVTDQSFIDVTPEEVSQEKLEVNPDDTANQAS